MYCLTDEQIEYILNDIRRNGVDTEDLQLNLLDHICCILEQGLKETDDFERFYKETVKQFYKTDMREIEEETINLLTFKNYYAMKKIMIVAGGISAAAFATGSLFKFMFWPGAAALLNLAMLMFSLVFMPLIVLLKVREKGPAGEKLVTGMGALTAVLFCMGTLFKVQHWPGANFLLFATMAVSAFAYIPAYFITGIRRPEKKLNTIISSVIMVSATGLLFTLMALRPPKLSPEHMASYYNNELLLKDMQRHIPGAQAAGQGSISLVQDINRNCEQLKSYVLQNATGNAVIAEGFKNGNVAFFDRDIALYFWDNESYVQSLETLKAAVAKYNAQKLAKKETTIPADLAILSLGADKPRKWTNAGVLADITQLQLYLVSAELDAGGRSVAVAN